MATGRTIGILDTEVIGAAPVPSATTTGSATPAATSPQAPGAQ